MVGEGRVKIFKVSFSGKEHILHIFGPGEPFGEVPVFHGQPFPASAEALEKTEAIFFPRREVCPAGGGQPINSPEYAWLFCHLDYADLQVKLKISP